MSAYTYAAVFLVGIALGIALIGGIDYLRRLDRAAEARRAFYDHQAFLAALDLDADDESPIYSATAAHIARFAAVEIDEEWERLMELIDPEDGAA